MRAYVHDGQEPHALHPKAGYIEARPNYSILTDFSCNTPPVHTSGSRAAASGIEPTTAQTMIVNCRRSGLPAWTGAADAASPRRPARLAMSLLCLGSSATASTSVCVRPGVVAAGEATVASCILMITGPTNR